MSVHHLPSPVLQPAPQPAPQAWPARQQRRPGAWAAALLALACHTAWAQAPAAAQPPAPDPRWVWDLNRLYASDAAWDAERQAVLAEIPALGALKATALQDAATLRSTLDRLSALTRRVQRLWVYASTQSSTDNRDRRNQERSALMGSLWGQLSAAVAWVDPALQSLGADKAEAWLKAEPGLAPHAVRMRNVQRLARHTLSPDTEAALAALGPVTASTSGTRSLLINADIKWPSITVDGKPVQVSEVGYQTLREHPDRAVRKAAFDAFYGTWAQYENTFGALLAQRVQQGVINARLRGYPSAAAASLAPFDIPESVMRQLVAQVNTGLPTLHRYLKLRQKLLKLPDLAYHDVYPDIVKSDKRYPPDVAGQLTLAAVKPLGDEYQAALKQALDFRNMHVFPAPGKSSGAYQTSVYGLPPLVFLNHRGSYDSLSTFAHEWGHGMHTALAQRAQPFETAGYPLFLAEIASMTNEVLLNHHMLQQVTDQQERVFMLGRMLEEIRGGFFRQAMFAEFELAAHDAQQRGEALSGKKFTQLYCGLLRKYHGADAGVMAIDPQVCTEWAYISHFHRPFYVYAYATSITAANHFGERILAGQPGLRDTYLGVLRAGSSQPAQTLLVNAGLDLSQPAPYQALVKKMDRILDEIEQLVGR